MFTLHERLAADTVPVRRLGLCQVLLLKNRVWPWLVLVPVRSSVRELHHLDRADRVALVEEVALASAVVERLFAPDKLNVGALGNLVPQLHVHVIGRWRGDPAWPGPVWGSGVHEDYPPAELEARVVRLSDALAAAAGSDG